MLDLNSKTLKWSLLDKTAYDKPMTTTSLTGSHALRDSLLPSTCPNRASKVVRGGQKGVLLHTKRKVSGKKHGDSEERGEEEGPFFLDQKAESKKDLPRALWSGIPWRGVTIEKKSNRRFHWSAQEMRTEVWPSSFFWVSGKLRWPLKCDEESAQ